MHFFFGSQEGGKADFVEVQLRGVERPVVIDELVLLGDRGLGSGTNRTNARGFAGAFRPSGGFHE